MFCHSAEKDATYHHAVLSSCQSQAGLQTWLLWPNWLWLLDWWGFQGEMQKNVYRDFKNGNVCVCLKPDRLNGVRHRRLVLELSTECAKTHYKHKVFIYLFCNLILFSFFKTIMIQFSNAGMILWKHDVQRPVVPLWSILNSIPAKQLPGNPCTVSVNMRSPGQAHTGLQVTRSLWIHT